MPLFRCTFAFLLLSSFAVAANAQTEKTFPTEDEINLVLTQTERAIEQYKPLIDQEIQLDQSATDAVAKDRQLVNALETAVKAFKRNPPGVQWATGVRFLRMAG